MSVSIKLDPISHKKLDKRFEILSRAYPEETFRAIVAILFDIRNLAIRRLKQRQHWITGRLANSIFVKTPKQKFAKRATNRRVYSFVGGTGIKNLSIQLKKFEGAVGTNVIYAQKIEDLDSYLEYAAKNVNVNKRLQEISKRANKKVK